MTIAPLEIDNRRNNASCHSEEDLSSATLRNKSRADIDKHPPTTNEAAIRSKRKHEAFTKKILSNPTSAQSNQDSQGSNQSRASTVARSGVDSIMFQQLEGVFCLFYCVSYNNARKTQRAT